MDAPNNPRQRSFVTGLVILGLILVAFFGLRTVRAFRGFHGHHPPPPFGTPRVETDVNLIRDWMTIPFISQMYHVKPHVLFEALEIPEQGSREKSLRQLNEEYYPEMEEAVLEKVKATVQAVLANQPQQIQIAPGTPGVP
ncbi:MAG: hypothetical protein ACXW4E_10590 [Anaerolineales bacterium]